MVFIRSKNPKRPGGSIHGNFFSTCKLFLVILMLWAGFSVPHTEADPLFENNIQNMVKISMDDPILLKTKQYSAYNPQRAAADAEKDLARGKIKIYYLDISEFPEPIGIDVAEDKLKFSDKVYLGIGCIDPYQADDCPPEYRKAMDNAIAYAAAYNQKAAEHLNLESDPKEEMPKNETGRFIGSRTSVHIELRDIQPLHGGRQIWLDSSGSAMIRSVRSSADGLSEDIYALPLDEPDTARILDAFILNDFVTISVPDTSAPPDQGRPEIILTNTEGKSHSIGSWDPPVPGSYPDLERFQKIYRELLRLETKARETGTPIHSGKYGDQNSWITILEKQIKSPDLK